MTRGLTDPMPLPEDEAADRNGLSLSKSEQIEMILETQDVVQTLITKHNELFDKVEKLEEKLMDLRIQHEAAKLVWQKGL